MGHEKTFPGKTSWRRKYLITLEGHPGFNFYPSTMIYEIIWEMSGGGGDRVQVVGVVARIIEIWKGSIINVLSLIEMAGEQLNTAERSNATCSYLYCYRISIALPGD